MISSAEFAAYGRAGGGSQRHASWQQGSGAETVLRGRDRVRGPAQTLGKQAEPLVTMGCPGLSPELSPDYVNVP